MEIFVFQLKKPFCSSISQYLESQSSARLRLCLKEQLAKSRESPERLNDLPKVSQLISDQFEIGPELPTFVLFSRLLLIHVFTGLSMSTFSSDTFTPQFKESFYSPWLCRVSKSNVISITLVPIAFLTGLSTCTFRTDPFHSPVGSWGSLVPSRNVLQALGLSLTVALICCFAPKLYERHVWQNPRVYSRHKYLKIFSLGQHLKM